MAALLSTSRLAKVCLSTTLAIHLNPLRVQLGVGRGGCEVG